MRKKQKKRIAIVDAGRRPEIVEAILPFIDDYYDLEITNDYNADYVFHSCLGYNVLKYSGIRIFVTGEYVSPDFNISDYALAFDPITFGDRYCQLPLIKLFRHAYSTFCAPRAPAEAILAKKTGFCAYVMSNTKDSAPEREQLFDALNSYKQIDCGGKWRNNVGGPVGDKIAFQSNYKFSLAIENTSKPGYLTEKFAHSAHSCTIPIYWGDPDITKIFNPKAFINSHDFTSLDSVAERVMEIDQNDTYYLEMLKQPWFIEEKEPSLLNDETYVSFLKNIFDQNHKDAFRRNRSRWGIKKEKQLCQILDRPIYSSLKRLYSKYTDSSVILRFKMYH